MNELAKNIGRRWQHLQGKKIFVACSGGLDSICLSHILYNLNFEIEVIHVNYNLRGKDSVTDAKFVSEFCQNLFIPFSVKEVDLKKHLLKGGNLQQMARKYRYDWFNDIISTDQNHFVALAHHRDDQVETFLLNLARNSGVMGLASMQEERDNIIRPLLHIKKEQLINYAKTNKLEWSEDQTNSTNKYRRNFLRNEIIPLLSSNIEDIESSILELINQFQRKQNLLELKIRPLINSLKSKNHILIEQYSELDEFERIEFFRQLDQPLKKSFELSNLIKVQKGKKVELEKNKSNPFFEIVKDNQYFTFNRTDIRYKDYKLVIENVQSLPSSYSKNEIYLDQSKIKGVLQLRRWRIGDRIHPLGVNGTKLVSDVITDAKVPSTEKDEVLVLHDEKFVHWCVGLKIGSKAIAKENSVEIIKCSVTY